jgi:hypothetical protein
MASEFGIQQARWTMGWHQGWGPPRHVKDMVVILAEVAHPDTPSSCGIYDWKTRKGVRTDFNWALVVYKERAGDFAYHFGATHHCKHKIPGVKQPVQVYWLISDRARSQTHMCLMHLFIQPLTHSLTWNYVLRVSYAPGTGIVSRTYKHRMEDRKLTHQWDYFKSQEAITKEMKPDSAWRVAEVGCYLEHRRYQWEGERWAGTWIKRRN